jgi:hypothetical protein
MRDDLITDATSIAADTRRIEFDATVEAFGSPLQPTSITTEHEHEALNLDPHQVKQAETQLTSADGVVTARLPEAYRYWYSTQPTVTKMAEDRAEQLTRNPDKVVQELDQRVRADLRKTGDFPRVHPLPQSGQDVPDDMDARLVVLGIDHPYSKEAVKPAEAAAKAILEMCAVMRRACSATHLCFGLG